MKLEHLPIVIVSSDDPEELGEGRGQARVCLSTYKGVFNDIAKLGISINGEKWETLGMVSPLGLMDFGVRPLNLYREKNDQSDIPKLPNPNLN